MLVRRTSTRYLVSLACVLLAACTGPAFELQPIPASEPATLNECDPSPSLCTGEVSFTFLGVGGFIIRAGDAAIMTGPSFTRPGLLRVAIPWVTRVHADEAEVERQLHRLLGDSLDAEMSRVRAVLVGHSHYDHAMDLPVVVRRHTPTARIIGGMTTKRILVGDPWIREHQSQIDSIPLAEAGTPTHPGTWIPVPGGRFRVMAIRSSHAPNVAGFTIADGSRDTDREGPPRNAWGWKLGDTYAYLIDVLDEQHRTVFRILYQDTAPYPEDAILPPMRPGDEHSLDVVILCAGNYANVQGHPQVVLGANRPRYAILGHWEDFFHSMDEPLTPIRFTDTETLRDRLNEAIDTRWRTPEPGGRIRVLYPVPTDRSR